MTQQAHAFADSELATQEFPEMTVAEAEQELLRIHPPRNDGRFHTPTSYSEHLHAIIRRGDAPKADDLNLEDLINEEVEMDDAPAETTQERARRIAQDDEEAALDRALDEADSRDVATVTAADVDVEGDDEGEWSPAASMNLSISNDAPKVESTVANAISVIMEDERTKGVFWYDEFSQRIVARKAFVSGIVNVPNFDAAKGNESIREEHIVSIQALLQATRNYGGSDNRDGYEMTKIRKADVLDAIRTVAMSKSYTYDSSKDMMLSVQHDGVRRIRTMFKDHFGVLTNPEYHADVAELMMVAMVARTFNPGTSFPYAPVMIAREGVETTRFLEILCRGQHVSVTTEEAKSKTRLMESSEGASLVQIPQLKAFGGSSDDKEHMISRSVDKARLAGKTYVSDNPRKFIVVVSTRNRAFLEDEVGGGLFLPVELQNNFDARAFKAIVPQLWAEAVALYQARVEACGGEDLELAPSVPSLEVSKKAQAAATVSTEVDVMASEIEAWITAPKLDGDIMIDGEAYYSQLDPKEIWAGVTGQDEGDYLSSGMSGTVSEAISRLDYLRKTGKNNKIRRRGRKCLIVEVLQDKFAARLNELKNSDRDNFEDDADVLARG